MCLIVSELLVNFLDVIRLCLLGEMGHFQLNKVAKVFRWMKIFWVDKVVTLG